MSIRRLALPFAFAALIGSPCLAQADAPADERIDGMMRRYDERTKIFKPCPRGAPGEIVVCGSPEDRGPRYRLPLPEERESAPTGPIPGEAPRASAAPVKQGSCGVVGGQGAGCTGGLPVLGAAMWVGKLIIKLADPDADIEAPPSLPDRYKGAGEH